MSSEEMVQVWLKKNEPKRYSGYTGTPKMDCKIYMNNKSNTERVMTKKRADNLAKYMEGRYA